MITFSGVREDLNTEVYNVGPITDYSISYENVKKSLFNVPNLIGILLLSVDEHFLSAGNQGVKFVC